MGLAEIVSALTQDAEQRFAAIQAERAKKLQRERELVAGGKAATETASPPSPTAEILAMPTDTAEQRAAKAAAIRQFYMSLSAAEGA
jgi:hypothetical protein